MMHAPPYVIPMRQVGGSITVFRGAAVPHIVQRGGGIGAFLGPLFRAGLRTAVPLAKRAAPPLLDHYLEKVPRLSEGWLPNVSQERGGELPNDEVQVY